MFTATVTTEADHILVTALGAGDEYLAGWQLPVKAGALAKRLARAIEAGKAVTVIGGVKSVNVMGRYMNADLKRLGY